MITKYLIFFSFLFMVSCTINSPQDSDTYINIPLTINVPEYFPALEYNLKNNPPTQKGFELGRKLFYDGRLASDGVVSCGFCHIQKDAFTHHGHTLSHGVNDGVGIRNTPPIQNMAFQKNFMWDGASDHLDMQAILPFTNPVEMNGNFTDAITMMQSDPEYQKLYKQAFQDQKINSENMLKALGQFMAMVTSSNSRYDQYKQNKAILTSQELEGYTLFKQKCATCHNTELFTDNSFRNNGLIPDPNTNDLGRYKITLLPQDKYKFKVPSLRNIEKTAPYMHDGRFFTLEKVLQHYTNTVQDSPTLDPILNKNATLGITLTQQQQTQIIAFLKTLTDNQYLTDTRFSENQ